jgi:FAD-dependent oxidoreductase domain-containing protein 1
VSAAAGPGRAADVVIAGGGVMGCAVAYFLTADPAFDGTVTVVERDPSYAACATARSWGGVRQQFSTPENVRLSLASLAFFREAETLLAVDGEGPDLAFREAGYLFLASPAGLPVLQANHRRQCALGAEIALLAPDALAARFPGCRSTGWRPAASGCRARAGSTPTPCCTASAARPGPRARASSTTKWSASRARTR